MAVSTLTGLDSTQQEDMLLFVKCVTVMQSKLVKLQTSCTVILPPIPQWSGPSVVYDDVELSSQTQKAFLKKFGEEFCLWMWMSCFCFGGFETLTGWKGYPLFDKPIKFCSKIALVQLLCDETLVGRLGVQILSMHSRCGNLHINLVMHKCYCYYKTENK